MERLRFALVLMVCLMLMFAFSSSSGAQSAGTGALTGTVTDQSGAVIAGATVTLTSKDTAQVRTAVTDTTGTYRFSLIPPGDYDVQFSSNGFGSAEVPSVPINVTETPVLNEQLKLGSQTERISVTSSDEALVQTETSTLGTLVNHTEITAVPLTTRNFTQVVSLSPGVTSDVNNGAALGKGSQDLDVNGSNQMMNNWSMDGSGANNWMDGVTNQSSSYGGIAIPNPDAIQEFKIQTSLYDAGYGRGAGANVNLVTKSGANDLHGTAFEFLRNTALNANDYFLKKQGHSRGVMNQNQFGGTLGGRIKKDKLFYFLSYQGTRQTNGIATSGSSSAILPFGLTDANRTAAGLGAAFCGQKGAFGTTAIACDGSNINPVAVAILQYKLPTAFGGNYYIPSPAASAGPSTVTRFTEPATFREDQAIFNLDYLISPKETLTERMFYGRDPDVLSMSAANGLPGGAVAENFGNANGVIKLTSLISPTFVNELRFGINGILSERNTADPLQPASVGMRQLNPDYSRMPVINVAGFTGSPAEFSTGGGGADGTVQNIYSYQWGDQISLFRGKHSIRFGYEGDRQSWHSYYYGGNRGTITFETFADFLLGGNAATNGTSGPGGNGMGNIFSWNGQYSLYPPGAYNEFRGNDSAAFAQDDIKVSPNLTVNLGVRWEYFGSVYDELGHLTGIDLGIAKSLPLSALPASGVGSFVGFTEPPNYLNAASSPALPPGIVIRQGNSEYGGRSPLNDFGPRVGLAWQPLVSKSFVVRAGYGWFYALVDANTQITPGKVTEPMNAAPSYNRANAGQATLQNPFVSPGGAPLATGWTLGRTLISALSNSLVTPSLKTQFVQQFNTNIQTEVFRRWVFQVGYVGTRGTHLSTSQPINGAILASATNPINCGLLVVTPANPNGCVSTSTISNVLQRVPYVGWSATGLSQVGASGSSFYNSLQVVLRSHTFHRLDMQAAYTYQKTMANDNTLNQATGGNPTTGSPLNFNDPLNKNDQWGPAGFDRTQRLIVTYNYQLPSFKNGEGFVGKMASGWSASGVTTVQSGLAMSVLDTIHGGTIYGDSGVSSAELCPGFTTGQEETSGGVSSRINNYFNKNAFANSGGTCAFPFLGGVPSTLAGPYTGTYTGANPAIVGAGTDYGNIGPHNARGPGQFNFDISLQKTTKVTENGTLQFRAEFFNAFNHAQFSNPGQDISSPGTFGVITSTNVAARLVQFGLKYIF